MSFNKIFVLGAGAVGSVYGALLSRKNDVTLIGNKTHVETMNSKGLTIRKDTEETFHVKADTELRDIPENALIILTTKAYDSSNALEKIKKLIKKDTIILVLQNGLGNEETVKRATGGKGTVLRGITTIAAEFFKAGEVRFWNGETIIAQSPNAEKIARVFNAGMLKTRLSRDIGKEIWNKLVINCVINPLTALFQVRNCEIAADSLKAVRHQLIGECVTVGKAEGIAFPTDLERQIDREIAYYTNFSSMSQDIMKGKKTEIDFLNGKIVELGKKHQIPTPVNETIVCLIKFLEEKNAISRKD